MRQANGARGSITSGTVRPDRFWSLDAEDLCREFVVRPDQGLTSTDARRRLAQHGPNQLRAVLPRSALKILIDQFRSVVVVLLCVAATVALWHGETAEGVAVGLVIVINTAIGFLTELRATRSMEALRKLGHFETRVRRDGQVKGLPADRLVPGDIVLLEGGDIVSADLRVLESSVLQADESALTGESEPVDKHADTLPPGTPLLERSNLLFKGTVLTRGSGTGLVIGTGYHTELGRIAELVSQAEAQETPLEKRLDALGQHLVWVMLAIAALIAGAGIATGRDTLVAIQVAVALMVAAIPEGLPIVATIALARGMWRMASRNALIVRLSAVETLGATGIILTDKTGTLTENRMTVREILVEGHRLEVSEDAWTENGKPLTDPVRSMASAMLETAVLCNNATLGEGGSQSTRPTGDPMEVALLMAAGKLGIEPESLRQAQPRIREWPFAAETRAMAVLSQGEGQGRLSVKGAPESIISACVAQAGPEGTTPLTHDDRRSWLSLTAAQAARGYRLLAVAEQRGPGEPDDPYLELTLLGIVCFQDPPRPDVRNTLERCRAAGIRLVMITGDHVATARHIAREVGLVQSDHDDKGAVDASDSGNDEAAIDQLAQAEVIARVSPQQKFALVKHFQDQGVVVAMTGDGVNDAPALKQADIGVAMGIRGTPVAREAAAMVLQDDRLSTIVEAIAQGRAIYANIRKFVVYLLSCNISEVLIVGLATLAGAPLPLLPLQILFLNLVTDVFPALALGVGEGHEGLMRRGPRPAAESLITPRHWWRIAAYGITMTGAVLGAMGLAIGVLDLSSQAAVTVSFCTLALAQLWHVFNMRDRESPLFRNEITANRWIWAATALCLALLAAAIYVPAVRSVLALTPPSLPAWGLILGASLLPLLFGPVVARLTSLPSSAQEPGQAES